MQRFLSFSLISHIDAHAIRGRPTLNDVERFQNGPVHELSNLKASQMCKVDTSSYEVTNEPYVSSNFENTGKTVTADLTTNYDAGTNTSLKKIKNVREHNFEGGAESSELDKDTVRSNLNSKFGYLSLALPLNILFLLLVFIGFNTCRVRFGISYIITIIIAQAILNVGLLFAWSCMCLAEEMMNILDDCDLPEKVVNMTNVHEHNDVTVSIKVQQLRSRCAESVYYNRTRVVCECNGYKRDREPSSVPVRMLKCLSQKIRQLHGYVRSD